MRALIDIVTELNRDIGSGKRYAFDIPNRPPGMIQEARHFSTDGSSIFAHTDNAAFELNAIQQILKIPAE